MTATVAQLTWAAAIISLTVTSALLLLVASFERSMRSIRDER